jgi:hypothetical protein
MEDQTKEQQEQPARQPGYSRNKTIELEIVTFADGSMVFPLRRTMSTMMATKRREFLGQKQDEIDKKVDEHKLDCLCDLMVGEPENVEDFPVDERPLAARTREYFGDAANRELLDDVWKGYWQVVKPAATFPKSTQGSN